MQDPLYSWMAQMNLVDIYPIFQKNGISLNQVSSLNEAELNEMGVNIGQRKRIFAATGRPVTPNANSPAPSYAAPSFGQVILIGLFYRLLQCQQECLQWKDLSLGIKLFIGNQIDRMASFYQYFCEALDTVGSVYHDTVVHDMVAPYSLVV